MRRYRGQTAATSRRADGVNRRDRLSRVRRTPSRVLRRSRFAVAFEPRGTASRGHAVGPLFARAPPMRRARPRLGALMAAFWLALVRATGTAMAARRQNQMHPRKRVVKTQTPFLFRSRNRRRAHGHFRRLENRRSHRKFKGRMVRGGVTSCRASSAPETASASCRALRIDATNPSTRWGLPTFGSSCSTIHAVALE